jgi:hypothetical protein
MANVGFSAIASFMNFKLLYLWRAAVENRCTILFSVQKYIVHVVIAIATGKVPPIDNFMD